MALSSLCSRLDHCFPSRARRWVAITLGLLDVFWFGGYQYGYNSLIDPYKELGLFAYNCTSAGCMYNDDMFGIGFIVWVVAQMCLAFVTGVIMDKIGLRAFKLLGTLMFFAGTLMFAYTRGSTPALYFLGGVFVSLGSVCSLISNHQISSMFPRFRGICVSLISGAYDSSAVLTFILAKRYRYLSIQSSLVIVAFVALFVGIFISLFILTERSVDMSLFANQKSNRSTEEITDDDSSDPDIYDEIISIVNNRFIGFKSVCISLPFLLLASWFTLGLFRFSMFLSQLQKQLIENFKSDAETVTNILNVSSAFSLCGIVVAPVTGFVLDISQRFYCRKSQHLLTRKGDYNNIYYTYIKGNVPGMILMAIFSVILSILIFIPNVYAIYMALLFFTIMRSLLFSCTINFMLISFPGAYFGKVNGLVSAVGGIFSLLQYSFLNTSGTCGNAVAAGAAVLLFIPPLVLFKMG